MDNDDKLDLSSIQDEVLKMKSELSESLKAKEKLELANQRLQSKLESSQSYAEELRLNVEKLSKELSQKKATNYPERIDKDCQTSEADFRKAALQWHCYKEETTNWSNVQMEVEDNNSKDIATSIVDEVKQIAADVSHQQFLDTMAFEETSGLYYDYKTGYYYDADKRLYYDGHSGTYYQYNYEAKEYEVHSRIPKRPKRNKNKDCSDNMSEGEIDSSDSKDSSDEDNNEAKGDDEIPPCLRIMVKSSETERVGTLFLVTVAGGTIGSIEGLEVALDEQGCSKYHAKIEFRDSKYYLTDLGSRNGTYVNGKRLSASKVESQPLEIGHKSALQIGKTLLDCHLHPGRETCFECEPGLLQEPLKQEIVSKAEKEAERKRAMKQIRKKYGLAKDPYTNQSGNVARYSDRAEKRRREVGSDNPNEKTEISHVDKSISSTNKGFKMLSKLGWKEGDGLGKTEQGRVEPVKLELRAERAGLGTAGSSFPKIDAKSKEKQELWLKTQKRFENIKDPPV